VRVLPGEKTSSSWKQDTHTWFAAGSHQSVGQAVAVRNEIYFAITRNLQESDARSSIAWTSAGFVCFAVAVSTDYRNHTVDVRNVAMGKAP